MGSSRDIGHGASQVGIILLGLLSLAILGCASPERNMELTLSDALKGEYRVDLPINTPEEAIGFSKGQGLLQKIPEGELKRGSFDNWKVLVLQDTVRSAIAGFKRKVKEGVISEEDLSIFISRRRAEGDRWTVLICQVGGPSDFGCYMSFRPGGEVLTGTDAPFCGSMGDRAVFFQSAVERAEK